MISGVYKITNINNGHCYIGSSCNINKRWWEHRKRLRLGTHGNCHLQSAWNKHGEDAFIFSIIEVCFVFALLWREQEWMDEIKPEYNIAIFAGASPRGLPVSDETRRKLSEAGKLRPPVSAETRAKLSAAMMGKKLSLGHKQTAEDRAKKSAAAKGRILSPEHRAKLSESHKANMTPERLAKMSAITKAWWEKRKENKEYFPLM